MMTDPDGHFAQFIPVALGGYRLYKGYTTYKKIKNLNTTINYSSYRKIRYSQSSIKATFKNGGNVSDLAKG